MPLSAPRLQALHAPPQPVLQQTPSTQLPEVHWVAPVQATPLPSFGAQLVPLQKLPAEQLASEAHEEGHEVPSPHT